MLYRFVGNLPQNSKVANQSQEQNILSTQTNTEGAVTVKVTPKTLIAESQAVFDVIFDTHSVDLNYTVAGISRLTDDMGNTYQPLSWTGEKGGHHVEGILTFPQIAKSAKKVTLTIAGIDKIDRIFSWNMK